MRLLATTFTLIALLAGPAAAGYEQPVVDPGRALLKSALLPGLGQIEQGRTGRGSLWAGGALLLGTATFYQHMQYHSAAEDFNNAEDQYRSAIDEGDADTAAEQFAKMERYGQLADDRYDRRQLLEIGLAALWAGNLVDTWLFGRGEADAGDTALLPGHLEPVLLRGESAGLAWTLNF